MKTSCKIIQINKTAVIEMKAGGYLALVAPTVGSNLMRLRDCTRKLEILRYDKKAPLKKLSASPCTYGMPTLYLPNRLSHGVLHTSDATYHLPINEGRFQNHLHGFLHTRPYTIIDTQTNNGQAIAKTRYVYDEQDPFFTYFPVKFQADMEFILDENGIHYQFTLTNLSDRQMPYGVCNHTAFQAPFTKHGQENDVLLTLPAVKKCMLNTHQLPTGAIVPLNHYDQQYCNGTKHTVKVPINNDMYILEENAPFYGATITDQTTGNQIRYEVDPLFRFFIVWNDGGRKGYFCPEPISWLIDAPNLQLPAEDTGYTELAPLESKSITERIYSC